MRRLICRLALVAAVIGSFSACQPLSKHPLIKPDEAKQDERLYGVWAQVPEKGRDPDISILHIGPAELPIDPTRKEPEPGAMQAWSISYQAKTRQFGGVTGLFFVTCPIEGAWIASISEGMNTSVTSKREWSPDTKLITDNDKRFWFLRYEVDGDTLKMWGTPDLDVIDKAITAGKLRGKVTRKKDTTIESIDLTDSTETLRAYFAESLNQLFEKDGGLVYKRADILPKPNSQ